MNDKQKRYVEKLASLAGLLLLVVAFTVSNDYFFTLNNIMTIGLQTSTIALIGIGATCPFWPAVLIWVPVRWWRYPAWRRQCLWMAECRAPIGMIGGILVGGCGYANEFLLKWALPPFIATLGMMMVARGGTVCHQCRTGFRYAESFSYLGNGALFRIVEAKARTATIGEIPRHSIPSDCMIFVCGDKFTFAPGVNCESGVIFMLSVSDEQEAARLSGSNNQSVKTMLISPAVCYPVLAEHFSLRLSNGTAERRVGLWS